MVRVLVPVALVGLARALPASFPTARHLPRPELVNFEQLNAGSAAATPEPHFTEGTMPKVSPALQCVMGLTMQYLIIYTCLAIVRTVNEFDRFAFIGVQEILEIACTFVTYAPVISVLFLGARMRAIQLTQGETKTFKLPHPWVQ